MLEWLIEPRKIVYLLLPIYLKGYRIQVNSHMKRYIG